MKTYQDLEKVGENEKARMAFVIEAIEDHKGSPAYQRAKAAESYYAKKNETIMKFQKMLYNLQGVAVPDLWSANYKLRTLFFRRFVIQQVQFVLANGVTFKKDGTKEKLGNDFDTKLQRCAKKAMVDGKAFGFWNLDHLEVFSFVDTEMDPGFVPLYDEETGQLRAGIRYWASGEALRATLYELNGYTDYIRKKEKEIEVLNKKRTYKQKVRTSAADGTEIIGGENYPGFPIITLYANDLHESELEGIRESIDCYDYIKSGLANDIDDTSGFYWVLKNSGGMDDVDLAKFIERMKLVRAATVDEASGVGVEAHTLDIPTEAREAMLNRLEQDLYRDFQIVNVSEIAAANKTATEIRAAYQPMEDKCSDFEYFLIDFIQKILELNGIQDEPSFKYNRITNQTEDTNMILASANLIGDALALKKLPFLTPEEAQQRIDEIEKEGLSRFEEA